MISAFKGDGVRARVLRSSGITLLEVGGSNFLRLLSNLVLTRLLFPEAFGLMALMQVFIYGLQMFSDIGTTTMLIQHKRGADTHFRNVLWTLQVMRGGVLWLGACALAWPVAWIYDQPMVLVLLPVQGLGLVIEGFKTTREPLANRELMLGRVVVLTLGAQVVALLVMVGLAFWLHSVWALVGGTLIGSAAKVIMLQAFLPGTRDRVAWDRSVFIEAVQFGGFIFLGTICTYFTNMSLQLILGAYLEIGLFGVFSIAALLGGFPGLIGLSVARKVIFPLYRLKPPQDSRENQRKLFMARRLLGASMIAFAGVLAFSSIWLIGMLYDDRYVLAGPMIVLICLRSVPFLTQFGAEEALLGNGDSRRHFFLKAVLAVVNVTAVFIGVTQYGIVGGIIGFGLASLMLYPLRCVFIARYQAWDPKGDMLLFGLGYGVMLTAVWLHWDTIVLLL